MNNNYRILNILIVDANRIFREGLLVILKSIENIGNIFQAGNVSEGLNELKYHACDLVLLDYLLPLISGASFTREIKRLYPSVKVIGLSVFDDEEHVCSMFSNGADGYLLKNTEKIEIELAISSVINGKRYFSRDIASGIINKTLQYADLNGHEKFKALNSREKEVLHLLYEEYSSKEIADRLFISLRTVEFYRQSLIRKTGSKNIVGLIKYAICNDLVKS